MKGRTSFPCSYSEAEPLSEESLSGFRAVMEAEVLNGFKVLLQNMPWHPGPKKAAQEIVEHVFKDLFPGLGKAGEPFQVTGAGQEAWPNSANLNLYRDGRQGVGCWAAFGGGACQAGMRTTKCSLRARRLTFRHVSCDGRTRTARGKPVLGRGKGASRLGWCLICLARFWIARRDGAVRASRSRFGGFEVFAGSAQASWS